MAEDSKSELSVEEHLAAGHRFLVKGNGQFFNFDFVLSIPTDELDFRGRAVKHTRTITFRGGQYDTADVEEITVLLREIKSSSCPNLASGEWVSKEQLDPMYQMRQKIISDYIASVEGASKVAVADNGKGDKGMVSTADKAVAEDPNAGLKKALAEVSKQAAANK